MTSAARRRALGLVAAGIVTMGAGAAPAAAAKPAALGWWWAGRPSATIPALFSPTPSVPEGGLYVAGDVTGPSGISALRYELAPGESATTLTLTIAETTATPIIDACVAAGVWKPAENGGWDQRPETDCEVASITGKANKDETEVSFSLRELQNRGRVLDLVFVPGVDPETQTAATFSVAFDPPGAEALAVTKSAGTEVPRPAAEPDAPRPPSPSFAGAATSPGLEPLAESETAAPPRLSGSQPTRLAARLGGAEGFAYPAVLILPLLLLVGGSYLAWALTRPVVARSVPET